MNQDAQQRLERMRDAYYDEFHERAELCDLCVAYIFEGSGACLRCHFLQPSGSGCPF